MEMELLNSLRNAKFLNHLLSVILIVNILNEEAVVGDESETKVGVCNYRGKSDPLQDAPQDIIKRNVDYYLATIRKAVDSENVKLIIFPEGGLTTLAPFQENRDVYLKYSLNISGWQDSCPCDDDQWSSRVQGHQAILRLSCAAKSNRVHVVVNILEKELVDNDPSSYNIFNTNLVFSDTGHIIVRYRKIIPRLNKNQTDKAEDNNNTFTVGKRMYKTIIGNDIYDESYSLKIQNIPNTNIVWSTASQKMNCKDIPALILAQVYGNPGMQDIFIADYSDDEWSSSCIYYNGKLYSSIGDQSDDELIIIPPDIYTSNNTRRKLNSNCLLQHILKDNTPEENKCTTNCTIEKGGTNGILFCIENFTTTDNERFNVSLCGINSTNNINSSTDKATIIWNTTVGTAEFFVPITADTEYWPLSNDMYDYDKNTPGRLSLKRKATFKIFALMRIQSTTTIEEASSRASSTITDTESHAIAGEGYNLIIIIGGPVVLVIIIIIVAVGAVWYTGRCTRCKKMHPVNSSNSNQHSANDSLQGSNAFALQSQEFASTEDSIELLDRSSTNERLNVDTSQLQEFDSAEKSVEPLDRSSTNESEPFIC